jgi:hypothetical protein
MSAEPATFRWRRREAGATLVPSAHQGAIEATTEGEDRK